MRSFSAQHQPLASDTHARSQERDVYLNNTNTPTEAVQVTHGRHADNAPCDPASDTCPLEHEGNYQLCQRMVLFVATLVTLRCFSTENTSSCNARMISAGH